MLEIVPLARYHDRSRFDCGRVELNAFLKVTARQHCQKGISRTFVLVEMEYPALILGFFTLTLCEVSSKNLSEKYAGKYPSHGLPAVRLARLAVSRNVQGKGYGALLLAEVIHRTVLIAEQAGLIGLFVDAKDRTAQTFYQRYGFVALPGHPQQLFLPLETLRSIG